MATMALLPAGLSVQEIWDQILDLLDRARDFKSCALVSRCLTPRAQFHLFHDITLAKPNDDPIRFDDGAACRRFFSILATSPHLARYIRCISIPFSQDVLTQVGSMDFPRLREILFCDSTANYSSREEDSSFATLDLAHGLIALPSVRSPLATSHIETLKVNSLGLRRSHTQEHLAPPHLAASPFRTRAFIKTLRVTWSPEIGEYLLNPECPFDLSQVEDVQISGSMTPAMYEILEGARFKIKLLECSAQDLTSGLRLEHFPSLACLAISGGGDDLPGITNASLSNANGNCIAKVVIDIQGDNAEDWDNDGMTRMDSVLSSSIVMPALQKVEIWMDDFYERAGSASLSKHDMIFSWFPLLAARGVLEVPAPMTHAQWSAYGIYSHGFTWR
ncbi:hypothetical protein K438DRAFT_1960510 [Mycena galopus ATCC 62051]|nr:hypothetical protein K438DRAFT_1960510 [Mycena galopus ATCC 62051]